MSDALGRSAIFRALSPAQTGGVGAFVLVLVGLVSSFPVLAEDQFSREAVLRFNTVCAHCHEGQCSGRLSFALGPEATYNHIRRFTGDVPDAQALELNEVLGYMKRHCAYAPLAPVAKTALSGGELQGFRDSFSGNYFLPLGRLHVGDYELYLELAKPQAIRVEIIADDFEPLVDECRGPAADGVEIRVRLEERTSLFLRVRSPNGLLLEQIRLSPQQESQ